jgi:hypothetical protein
MLHFSLIVTGKLSTHSGKPSLMMNSLMHIGTALSSNVAMELKDGFTRGYLRIPRITLKSKAQFNHYPTSSPN